MDPHQKASVYDQLLDRIVNGPLQPGAVLRDTAIAEELGVSRTPVREALIRMSQEGFVDFHRGHKTIVSMIDYDRAGELYAVGAVLDSHAALLATPRMDQAAFDTMRSTLDEMDATSDARRLYTLDAQFHAVYYDAAGNCVLTEHLQRVTREVVRVERAAFENRTLKEAAHDEHEQILAAMKGGDSALAQALAGSNWRNAWARIQEVRATGLQAKGG